MRRSVLWREIVRDVASGTSRLVWFATIAAIVLSSLCAAELLTTRTHLRAAQDYQAAGASTLTITSPGRIDGAACDALGSVSGIEAAGAVTQEPMKLTASALPSAPMMHYIATPGLPGVLAEGAVNAGGLFISSDVALTLGLRPGDSIRLEHSESNVSDTYEYPSDGRRAGFGWAVIEVTDDPTFDECWIRAWPVSEDVRASLLLVLLDPDQASSNDAPQIGQLNSTLGQSFTGSSQFAGRITRFSPLVGFAFCVAIGWLSIRLRRLQFASNLHAGLRRIDLVSIATLETIAWAAPAAVVAIAASLVLAGTDFAASDTAALRGLALMIILCGLVGSVVGALAAQFAIRERHLFTYFKDR